MLLELDFEYLLRSEPLNVLTAQRRKDETFKLERKTKTNTIDVVQMW